MTRKIEALLAGGARVTVVAKEFSPAVEERAARGDLTVLRGAFHPDQMREAELVFVATPDRALNRRVSAEARRRRIPVNVADSPEECTFLLPAVVRGDEFTAAISTGGRHPGAAKALREFLEDHRAEISVRLERGRRRKRIAARPGKVYIVGAGPGDPDLLTVRALGLLRSADAVIYDYLVPAEILSLAPAKAARISFARRGRTAGHGAAPQAERDPRGDGPARAGREIRRPPQIRRPARVRTGRRGGGASLTGRDSFRDRSGDHRRDGVRGGGGHIR